MSHQFLQYAYTGPVEWTQCALGGSLIRALGKGWRVQIGTPEYATWLLPVSTVLANPSQLQFGEQGQPAELVLSPLGDQNRVSLDHEITAHQMVAAAAVVAADFDLVSEFSTRELHPTGVIAITGTGKGKTTSALGMALEKVQLAEPVCVIQWFKEKASGDLTWAINEHRFPLLLKQQKLLDFFPTGLGFFGSPSMDRVAGGRAYLHHREKAYQGLQLAEEAISSGKYGLVVLDELIDTVVEIAGNIPHPLIDKNDLQDFFKRIHHSKTPVVVTGRRVNDVWSDWIKTSVEITEIKHPWSTRKAGAVSGLDF